MKQKKTPPNLWRHEPGQATYTQMRAQLLARVDAGSPGFEPGQMAVNELGRLKTYGGHPLERALAKMLRRGELVMKRDSVRMTPVVRERTYWRPGGGHHYSYVVRA